MSATGRVSSQVAGTRGYTEEQHAAPNRTTGTNRAVTRRRRRRGPARSIERAKLQEHRHRRRAEEESEAAERLDLYRALAPAERGPRASSEQAA